MDEIRFASQSAYFERRTLEALGIGPLEARRRARLLDGSAGGEAEAGVLDVAEGVLRRHARALIDQRFEVFGQAATDAFMADALAGRALADFTPSDLDEMKAIAQRMARRLAARHGGRHRVNRRGHLDIRRTLRANAGSEVPFKLVLKKRRPAKPRIVALCDVSGSVARHSRFLLLLLSALDGTAVDLRAFAFSNHLHDISVPLRDLQGDAAITAILRNSGSGSTDYGQTFVELRDQHWTLIDRRTTVLVLGDGRSNYTNPRLDIFKDMAERAKRVVWLCSEARGRWGTSDSCMLTFAPYCTHVSHCVTALDLERIVEDAMEAYS